jgi:glycerol-3-phosphate dehydrogenase (NAD(P)+)
MDIAREYHLELPICALVYAIVHEHKEPKEELLKLFLRDTKTEQE